MSEREGTGLSHWRIRDPRPETRPETRDPKGFQATPPPRTSFMRPDDLRLLRKYGSPYGEEGGAAGSAWYMACAICLSAYATVKGSEFFQHACHGYHTLFSGRQTLVFVARREAALGQVRLGHRGRGRK